MKIAAIICEFNPFHNGHKYLIDKVDLVPDNIPNPNRADRKMISKIKSSFFKRHSIVIASFAICIW